MKKSYIIGVVAVVVLAAVGALVYLMMKPPAHLLSGSINKDGDFVHEEHGEFYDIELKLPARTPLWALWDIPFDTKARFAMEQEFKKQADQFLIDSQATSTTLENSPWMADGRKYTLSSEYAGTSTAHTASYEYEIYEDTGGAHPNAYYTTFVFDRKGNELSLRDLFAPDSKYLPTIALDASTQVKAQIAQRLGLPESDATDAIFEDGLAPTEENFSNFVITPTELVFFLPPYQVAPYAAGTFEIHVPLSQLRDILRKDLP